jgi:hypothetical protein
MPEFNIDDKRIDLVEQVMLLGVVISSNLTWSANTTQSQRDVTRKTGFFGASQADLLDVYTKQIRSLAEFGVPVWNSSLT